MILMTVGERIQLSRKRMGISQVDFAAKINVSKQTLYKYENNLITNIPSDKIEAVANLCHVTPAYLMGWNNEANSTSNEQHFDQDLVIIQREKSKMSAKDQAKLMNILKANFDEYNWDEDDSGDIE